MAAIAAAATILPIQAEVQPGTSSLLDTISKNGILVTLNHPDCATNQSYGQYRWIGIQRELRLCPGASIDAIDHQTVRHEVAHAIQHCVNAARGTDINTPVINTREEFVEFVAENLSEELVDVIIANYPKEQAAVELEAFAAANHYSASELEKMFLKACVAQTPV